MNKTEFAGFTWPKKEWALPKGFIANRVRKVQYASGYYEIAPRRAEERKDVGFYHGEFRCLSGRQFDLRGEVLKEGWYADSYCDDVWIGIVFRLPGDRGFLAGATMGEEMCAHVSRHVHAEEREAKWEANRMAERAAEESREFDAKDQAEQEIERLQEEIKDDRAGILEALGERKGATEVVQRLIRIFVVERLASIRKTRKRIAALEGNYWLAVQH